MRHGEGYIDPEEAEAVAQTDDPSLAMVYADMTAFLEICNCDNDAGCEPCGEGDS